MKNVRHKNDFGSRNVTNKIALQEKNITITHPQHTNLGIELKQWEHQCRIQLAFARE